MVDFHNHVMPGVDDGAQDIDESIEALRQMSVEGVVDVIATPHVDGSLTVGDPAALAERLAVLDEAYADLCAAAAGRTDLPGVRRGAELKLDTPQPDVSDPRLRLAGTAFVLAEFPFMSVPPQSARAIEWLRMKGWIPIVAHPERYRGIESSIGTIESWRQAGAYLQVNCGSLLGRYGPEPRRVAMLLLKRGWIDYLASDHHARGTLPHRATKELLEKLGGSEQAQLLLVTNPARLVAGEAPLPVQPLAVRAAFWSRIAEVFR